MQDLKLHIQNFNAKLWIKQNIYRKVNLPLFEAKKLAWKQKIAWYFSIQKAMQEKTEKWLNWPDIWSLQIVRLCGSV